MFFLDQSQFSALHSNQWDCFILYRQQIVSNDFFRVQRPAFAFEHKKEHQWHTWLLPCMPLFFSYHILTSSVSYYWTDTQQHTVLCNSNANVFHQNSRLFLAFRRKNIEFSMEANFQRKVTIISGAYCLQLREFSHGYLFGTKSDFEFSSKKSLCSINDLEHMSEISLCITCSSAQTFRSILWMTICQVRSCCDDSFVLSSH